MHILIDSTELKKDRGLNKKDITFIKDLGKEKLITLHIPYFVYRECASSSINNLQTELNNIKATLKSFDRKGMGSTDYHKSKELAEKEIESLLENIIESNKQLWDEFISTSNAEFYEFDEKDSISVFEAYFSGNKPFKSLKNRDDIPDAFIFETVQKITKSNKLHLISGDKNLREKCSELENIKVFTCFKEFYEDEDFLEVDSKYRTVKDNQLLYESKKAILLDNKESFELAAFEYVNKVRHLDVYNTSLPSDNGEATVYAIDNAVFTIDESNIKFIDNKFFVPVTVKGEASIDYAVFKADYWALGDTPGYSEDLNKHYYLVEDQVPITLRKTISVNTDSLQEEDMLEIDIEEFDEIELGN